MKLPTVLRQPGVVAALTAALLFGLGTPPRAKLLLHDVSPWMMAGLLYAGAGTGRWFNRRLTGAPAVRLPRREALWLADAVLARGLCGPVLLMFGLTGMSASGASLLLNA